MFVSYRLQAAVCSLSAGISARPLTAAVFYTVSQKNVPTFKLSVTLSNLDQFSKFLHCRKAHEICYKKRTSLPPHLRHVATLPREIKFSNFCRYSADVEETQINCISSAPILISLHV